MNSTTRLKIAVSIIIIAVGILLLPYCGMPILFAPREPAIPEAEQPRRIRPVPRTDSAPAPAAPQRTMPAQSDQDSAEMLRKLLEENQQVPP